MILKFNFSLIILLAFETFFSILNAQNTIDKSWELVKNNKGISIYVRKHKNSSLKETLGIVKVETSLSSIIALLKDTKNHKNWMYANKKSKVLNSNNNFEWVLYTESEAPWPIKNRDLITHSTMNQDVKTCQIKINSYAIPSYITKKSGLVRIKEMNSEWQFTVINKSVIEIRFKILINLGGNLPIWLTNLAVDKGPYYTLSKMKLMLKSKKYQYINIPYIKDYCE